jgi:hypothetical protein
MSRTCERSLIVVACGTLSFLSLPSPAMAQGYLGANLRPFAVLAGTTEARDRRAGTHAYVAGHGRRARTRHRAVRPALTLERCTAVT